ncbi:voltage-gated potassium channel KCNC1-like [Watersipora subatra]|uniref:voltage-gated potassium channel KCNC1-like n=1 Tax=Watersipora subatra TaxID=2589382 RepID=UPI00355BF2C3
MLARDRKEKVTLNVGGFQHKTLFSTLEKIPGTRLHLLARRQKQDESYNAADGEYFFDRNPKAFMAILQYYRTGELHMTKQICGNAMKKELLFWGIYETEIETCCWGDYSKFLSNREALASLDEKFTNQTAYGLDELSQMSTWKRRQAVIWNTLEYPSYSRAAKVITFLSIMVVMVSILSFICESHFWFRVLKNDTRTPAENPEEFYKLETKKERCLSNYTALDYPSTVAVKYLDYVEWSCLTFFGIELIVRLLFCPNKCEFIKSMLNIIDVICIISQAVSTILEQLEHNLSTNAVVIGDILQATSLLRTMRVLRVFKLMKHYGAFKILAYTIKVSTKELLLIVIFLLSGVLVFASAVHYAEPTTFTSIPIGIWWAVVTMTTVGYGDKAPSTPSGYVFGCLATVGGVLVIAFTVPIVVNNFTLYYSHANSRANAMTGVKAKSDRMRKNSVAPMFDVSMRKSTSSQPSMGIHASADKGKKLNIRPKETISNTQRRQQKELLSE